MSLAKRTLDMVMTVGCSASLFLPLFLHHLLRMCHGWGWGWGREGGGRGSRQPGRSVGEDRACVGLFTKTKIGAAIHTTGCSRTLDDPIDPTVHAWDKMEHIRWIQASFTDRAMSIGCIVVPAKYLASPGSFQFLFLSLALSNLPCLLLLPSPPLGF